jgi:hypothetical protein
MVRSLDDLIIDIEGAIGRLFDEFSPEDDETPSIVTITFGKEQIILQLVMFEWGSEIYIPIKRKSKKSENNIRNSLEKIGGVFDVRDDNGDVFGLKVVGLDDVESAVDSVRTLLQLLLLEGENVVIEIE